MVPRITRQTSVQLKLIAFPSISICLVLCSGLRRLVGFEKCWTSFQNSRSGRTCTDAWQIALGHQEHEFIGIVLKMELGLVMILLRSTACNRLNGHMMTSTICSLYIICLLGKLLLWQSSKHRTPDMSNVVTFHSMNSSLRLFGFLNVGCLAVQYDG